MPRKKRTLSPFELMDDDFDDTSSQSSRNGNPPIQRNAANARERARMRVLSSAFGRLKTKLPNIPADTKLSKLDTLRLATMYIKQLKTVVEGGAASRTTNAEHMERSLNNHHENNSTNCYLNLNMGAQSMNWPFGFHHHLTSTSLIRSTSAMSLNNNWCTHDKSSNTEEQRIEQDFYENENYQQQPSSFMQHTTLRPQYNKNNHQHNHWCSETPSPELDSTSSSCLNFENSQHQLEHTRHPHYHHHHHQQLISNHHHNLSQPSTFQLQHNFHYHTSQEQEQQHQPTVSHHLHHNGFANSTNFQSTSIR